MIVSSIWFGIRFRPVQLLRLIHEGAVVREKSADGVHGLRR
jgi:hypothetical protein